MNNGLTSKEIKELDDLLIKANPLQLNAVGIRIGLILDRVNCIGRNPIPKEE